MRASPHRLTEEKRIRVWDIEGIRLEQPCPMRAHEACRECLILAEPLLDAGIPLDSVRQLQLMGETGETVRRARRRLCHNREHARSVEVEWIWVRKEGVDCLKSRLSEPSAARLIASVEIDSSAAAEHGLPALSFAQSVRDAQPGSKIEPRGVPERRALRRRLVVVETCALVGIRHEAAGSAWRRVHLPAQAHGK